MAKISAANPDEYLAALPAERQALLSAVRDHVNRHVPDGYQESVNWGAITWEVPLSVYPDTYNGQPMTYVAMASHKSTATLYLMGAYGDPALRRRLEAGFKAAGKRLDMGKSCLHFHKLDDLPMELIGEIIAAVPMKRYVERAKAGQALPHRKKAGKTGRKTVKTAARKTAARRMAKKAR